MGRRQAPTCTCTLILGFGGRIRLHGPAGRTEPSAFLAGMHDAAVIAEFTGRQHGVQVDLTPLGVYELLGRPLPELTNRAVPSMSSTLPTWPRCRTGWQRTSAGPCASPASMRWLLVPPDPSCGPPAGRVTRTMADVAATCGYADHSHLVRDFHALAGCTPSAYLVEWHA